MCMPNFNLAEEDVYRFQRERDIMANLDHENIVKMFELFEDQDHYYMVLELVSGGELFEQIVEKGSFEEQECARLILQVIPITQTVLVTRRLISV